MYLSVLVRFLIPNQRYYFSIFDFPHSYYLVQSYKLGIDTSRIRRFKLLSQIFILRVGLFDLINYFLYF